MSLSQKQAKREENYWRNIFSTGWFPTEIKIPYKKPTFNENTHFDLQLPKELQLKIISNSKNKSIPVSNIILSAFYVTLMHMNDLKHQVISLQLKNGILLPLSIKLNPNISFIENALKINKKFNYSLNCLSYPFVKIALEEFKITPKNENILTPIVVNLSNEELRFISELSLEFNNNVNNFTLTIINHKEFVEIEFLKQILSSIINILDKGLESDLPIKNLELLTSPEITETLQKGKGKNKNFESTERIETIFLKQAVIYPKQVAIMHCKDKITYSELNLISDYLAKELTKNGVQKGNIIAILMQRSISMIVTILSVLKAGAIYMPIDPDYPDERIELLLNDSKTGFVITYEIEAQTTFKKKKLQIKNSDKKFFFLNPLTYSLRAVGVNNYQRIKPRFVTKNSAYLMFTSGTTGRPKGVLISHEGVINLVCNTNFINIDIGTRISHAGATGFDASVLEIWGALLNGGCLQIIDREILLDNLELNLFFKNNQTDIAFITTSLFSQLANEEPTLFAQLKHLIIGGDNISAKPIKAVFNACPDLKITNAYGPTENAVISTTQLVGIERTDRISIGKPINNSTAIVLNQFDRMLPSLFEGELCVGGVGLSLGYINNSEETKRKFILNPYTPKERLYKTGDRVVWNFFDELEFLGRRDNQIKIRGYRIELGEIEKTILSLQNVNEVVIIPKKSEETSEYLLNCFIGVSDNFNLNEFNNHLIAKIPHHMIPSIVIPMKELPLLTNGKIDRNALINMTFHEKFLRENQKSKYEHTICNICKSLLGLPSIDVNSDLCNLGLNSLTAAILTTRIRQKYKIKILLSETFKQKTVSKIAKLVEKKLLKYSLNSLEILSKRNRRLSFPASPQQIRLFIEQSKLPNAVNYNLPLLIELPINIDFFKLKTSLNKIILRHECLRTRFIHEDHTTKQIINNKLQIQLIKKIISNDLFISLSDFIHPFDLSQSPLWRVAICVSDKKNYLFFDIHHILTDGYSLKNLLYEWEIFYNGGDLPKQELQYSDYALWLHSDEGCSYILEQESFWIKNLSNLPNIPDLPIDFKRSNIRSVSGNFLKFDFGHERSQQVFLIAKELEVSVFQFLLSCYGIFLSQILGCSDLTVGSPAVGRLVPGTEKIQGMFVNTLCLRLKANPDLTFKDYLQSVSEQTLQAFDNQDFPMNQLVKRLASNRSYNRNPLFDTMFALQNTGLSQQTFLGGNITWIPSLTKSSIYDMNLQIEEISESLKANWHFNKELFLMKTIESFKNHFFQVIDQVITNNFILLKSINKEKEEKEEKFLHTIEFNF